ncbi:hypothetical protein [Bradyrhizobium sp. RDT46]|uniref:hypothetical protein n=1 Tax=Bradyrhizobium sp. RDT46 TaxID=3341829 RepID=UPI0035C669D5
MLYVTEYARRAFLSIAIKSKPRSLNRDRRRYLVDTVAAILDKGEPTKFAREAACRNGLRAAFCLDGYRWAEADDTAADILAAAFRQLGVQRPTWKEGQPECTQDGFAPIERTRCLRCSGPLPEGHDRFCSKLCGKAWRACLHAHDRRAELAAKARALRAAYQAKAAPRPCEQCGFEFRPFKPKQRFCCKACSNRANGAKSSWHDGL